MKYIGKAFASVSIAGLAMSYAGNASAASFPSGDWEAHGVLTAVIGILPFTCQITMFGRANGSPGAGGDGTGVITAVRFQNVAGVGSQACGGVPGFIRGVRAVFTAPDYDWPYQIDPINNEITIQQFWISADPLLGTAVCGSAASALTLNWSNGDPTFADGNVTWSVISGPGTVTGMPSCTINGRLEQFFKVGHVAP